jgi:hypothetical protein
LAPLVVVDPLGAADEPGTPDVPADADPTGVAVAPGAGEALAGADAPGELAAPAWDVSHASYSGRVTARTVSSIRSWYTPQNSAHWPPYEPGWSTVKSNWVGWPGMASRLNRKTGT